MHSTRIGTAGWSIPRQFAAELPAAGTHLERYAHAFPCAEINSSFYRPHRLATWTRWAASVPGEFRFCVKAPKTITHEAQLACTAENSTPAHLQAFLAQATTLGDKLGPILFQLPPRLAFAPTTAETFLTLLRHLHLGPIVFEPRHPSWFATEPDALLQRFHVARVAADPARIPEAARPGGWPGLTYYRLHGSPRIYYSAYGEAFLQNLADDLTLQRKNADLWCIFDNTTLGAAFGDARILQRLLTAT